MPILSGTGWDNDAKNSLGQCLWVLLLVSKVVLEDKIGDLSSRSLFIKISSVSTKESIEFYLIDNISVEFVWQKTGEKCESLNWRIPLIES